MYQAVTLIEHVFTATYIWQMAQLTGHQQVKVYISCPVAFSLRLIIHSTILACFLVVQTLNSGFTMDMVTSYLEKMSESIIQTANTAANLEFSTSGRNEDEAWILSQEDSEKLTALSEHPS